MADKKVKIYSDKPVRWRIQGSQLWINLAGGQWNDLPVFSGGERIEISSQLTITELKIHGDIKEVNIPNSELTNLNGSFEGTRNLNTVYLRSGAAIDTAENTFNDSGVLSFDIDTSSVANMTGFAKNTFRLESASVSLTSSLINDYMFYKSNLSSFSSITGMKFSNSLSAFSYSENLKGLGGIIDLRVEPDNVLRNDIVYGSQWLDGLYNISYINGKVLDRKIYPEETFDSLQDFEMEIKQESLDTSVVSQNIEYSISGETIDPLQNFEADISLEELNTSYSSKLTALYGHNIVTTEAIDPIQNFEMDCYAVETDASYKGSLSYDSKRNINSVAYDPTKTFVFDMRTSVIEVKNDLQFYSKNSLDISPIDGSKDFEFNVRSNFVEIKKSLDFESKRSFDNTAIDVAQDFEFNIDASYIIV